MENNFGPHTFSPEMRILWVKQRKQENDNSVKKVYVCAPQRWFVKGWVAELSGYVHTDTINTFQKKNLALQFFPCNFLILLGYRQDPVNWGRIRADSRLNPVMWHFFLFSWYVGILLFIYLFIYLFVHVFINFYIFKCHLSLRDSNLTSQYPMIERAFLYAMVSL